MTFADSLVDYGQLAMSEGGVRHIMYSAATAQSTMDFSMMDVDDNVVDSPPNGGKRPVQVNSPSPLKCRPESMSPRDRSKMNPETQRKLYDEEMDLVVADEVRDCHFVLSNPTCFSKSFFECS